MKKKLLWLVFFLLIFFNIRAQDYLDGMLVTGSSTQVIFDIPIAWENFTVYVFKDTTANLKSTKCDSISVFAVFDYPVREVPIFGVSNRNRSLNQYIIIDTNFISDFSYYQNSGVNKIKVSYINIVYDTTKNIYVKIMRTKTSVSLNTYSSVDINLSSDTLSSRIILDSINFSDTLTLNSKYLRVYMNVLLDSASTDTLWFYKQTSRGTVVPIYCIDSANNRISYFIWNKSNSYYELRLDEAYIHKLITKCSIYLNQRRTFIIDREAKK